MSPTTYSYPVAFAYPNVMIDDSTQLLRLHDHTTLHIRDNDMSTTKPLHPLQVACVI